MPESQTVLSCMPKPIGIAADHGGLALKEQLVRTILVAQFRGTERHRFCPAKIAGLENGEART